MINIIKDRLLESGQQVLVYRNLNKGKLFSIKDKKTGLVVAHADRFIVRNVTCKVSQAGRNRVIRDKRKNVHATLLCEYVSEVESVIHNADQLYYNPYTLDSFINKTTGEKVERANEIYFVDEKAYILD